MLVSFSCVLYYIKLHYITLSYYLVYASLLSLLQLFFCLHVRLLYAIKYYLLTFLQQKFNQPLTDRSSRPKTRDIDIVLVVN